MFYSEICLVLGKYFLYLAAILLIPLGISAYYDFVSQETIIFSTSASLAFLKTIGICLVCCGVLSFFGRKTKGNQLHRKESILFVTLIWFITSAIGSLPFLFTKTINNPLDAYFESMSGLTTTGASIVHAKAYDEATGEEIPLTVRNPLDPAISYTFYGTVAPIKDPGSGKILKEGIEALGKPLLFWRSFLQWFGGLGIVVLFITILPALGLGGKFLYESEMTGPNKEGMTPRIKETAAILWKIYLGLTIAQVLLLLITDTSMPLFDAVTLSFTTISTGGFTIHNDGLARYHHMQWILLLFMVLGGLNFSLYFHFFKRKIMRLYDQELFYYLAVIIIGSLLMTLGLWRTPYSFKDAISFGSFQAVSAQTTTGFTLTNYDAWPLSCQILMIILMFIAGMSGSTAGGIKIIRFLIVWKIIKSKIEAFFRPDAVRILKVGAREIADKTAMLVLTFFCIMIFLVVLGTYLLVLDNNDPVTAFSVISTSITNTGLYFGGTGALGSFAFLSPFSKIISILWMILGRLEFFSLLVLLVPSFWKSR